MFIVKVIKKLKEHKIPYVLVGGHAVALHGAIRGTLDIDFIIKWSLKNLQKIEEAFKEINLISRLPISPDDLFRFRSEYIKNRNLIAWNFINPQNPMEQVDIVLTFDAGDVSIKKIKLQGEEINLISKKDLIKMKKKSGRKQDFIDIEALEKIDEKK